MDAMQSGWNYEWKGYELGAKEKGRERVVKVEKKVRSAMSIQSMPTIPLGLFY